MKRMLVTSKEQRTRRVRARIRGSARNPRLSVFRSNKHFYAQVIDDERGVTLTAVSDQELNRAKDYLHVKVEQAFALGKLIAERAKAKGVERVVFDRGPYRYHGRIKSFAEGAREGGLGF